ncbi:DnaJ domain-containing protein [Ramlibacter montanisoli]|uniref:DnaJ domain-containing protein n=1 Tax=Ramlibacter montanisoli TaxID=2732512 RepID=A0A849KTM8_9BURK|nr:DnaJ domain-containing protein [Ramlibacter montanisoli]NNU45309.1 DnaJ domain-containing protein [Ramlibacter montanisoli]
MLYPGADHYAVMGFGFGTETSDLKERYRLLMRLIHPDFAQAGAAAWPADAAMRVNRANEVLSSPTLRREYEEQLANLKQQRPAGVAKAASHAPAAAVRRQQEPRLQVGKRAAWALGITLTGMAVLMLMPRQEPDHLVQRKTAAPATVPRDLPRAQEPLALPPAPTRIAELPVLPAVAERAPAQAPVPAPAPAPAAQWDRLGQLPSAPPQAQAAPRPVAPVAARTAPAAPSPPAALPMAAAPARPPQEAPATVPPPLPAPLPSPVVAAIAVAPVASPPPAAAPVASAPPVARAAPAVAPPIPSPTLSDAQPLLTQLLQMLETGSGDQLLRLLEADARQSPGAQALSRNFEQLVKGARPVHLSQVEFKGEPRDGVLLVTGRIRLHAGRRPSAPTGNGSCCAPNSPPVAAR